MNEHSQEMAAAIAAMRAEWQQIRAEVLEKRDPQMEMGELVEWAARRHELLRGFYTRHAAALAAANPGAEAADLAPMEEKMVAFLQADEEIKALEERLLQARANAAEARQERAEEALSLLAKLEALSPEDWAKADGEQRALTYELLCELQEERPKLLAELPMERRRHWEPQ